MCKASNGDIEKVRKLAETLFSQACSYHRHKETMAHACIALELALLAWVLSNSASPELPWAVGIGFAWFLIHVYMRWQLRLRRWGVIQAQGLQQTLKRCATGDMKNHELKRYGKTAKPASVFCRLLDHVFPIFRARVPCDARHEDCPIGLMNDVRKADIHAEGSAWSMLLEQIVTLASFLLLCFILAARCFSPLAVLVFIGAAIICCFARCLVKLGRKKADPKGGRT